MDYYCKKCGQSINPSVIGYKEGLMLECPHCGTNQSVDELVAIADRNRSQLAIIPPQNSRIEATRFTDSIVEIDIPREGFSKEMTFPLLFAFFWLAFVAFWTVGAASASIVFALFSIPFWMAGVSMMRGLLSTIFERQRIELNGNKMKIKTAGLLKESIQEINLDEVKSVKLEKRNMLGNVTNMAENVAKGRGLKVPTISHKDKKSQVLEHLPTKDKEWFVEFMDTYMKVINEVE